VRNQGAAGDALPASADPEGRRRGALLRPGRELPEGPGVVPQEDAALVPGPDNHREESQLLCVARGECCQCFQSRFDL